MNKYIFSADSEAVEYCDKIVEQMVLLFDIPLEEAFLRINQQWGHMTFIDNWVLYHNLPDQWAKEIFWEDGTYWWIEGEARAQLQLPPLTPKTLGDPK